MEGCCVTRAAEPRSSPVRHRSLRSKSARGAQTEDAGGAEAGGEKSKSAALLGAILPARLSSHPGFHTMATRLRSVCTIPRPTADRGHGCLPAQSTPPPGEPVGNAGSAAQTQLQRGWRRHPAAGSSASQYPSSSRWLTAWPWRRPRSPPTSPGRCEPSRGHEDAPPVPEVWPNGRLPLPLRGAGSRPGAGGENILSVTQNQGSPSPFSSLKTANTLWVFYLKIRPHTHSPSGLYACCCVG